MMPTTQGETNLSITDLPGGGLLQNSARTYQSSTTKAKEAAAIPCKDGYKRDPATGEEVRMTEEEVKREALIYKV